MNWTTEVKTLGWMESVYQRHPPTLARNDKTIDCDVSPDPHVPSYPLNKPVWTGINSEISSWASVVLYHAPQFI